MPLEAVHLSTRRAAVLVGLVWAIGTTSLAAAQDPSQPPCAPGATPAATIRGSDLEDSGGPLTATHTITLDLDTPDGPVSEFTITVPPSAETLTVGPGPALRADAPGQVPVTATWTHFDAQSGSFCNASAQATINLEAATRPRFSTPPARARQMTELNWRLRVGKDTDLRPVEARLRGVRNARLPGASAPVKTIALGLRRGDPNRMLVGTGRVLRSAGWRFRFGPSDRGDFPISMRKFEKSPRRGFGFVLELVQAGRRIGRTRAVGRCEFSVFGTICRYRTVK